MANWNPNYNATYGGGGYQPFYPDSAYGTAANTSESEDGRQQTSSFDRRQLTATPTAAQYGQSGPWSAPAGATYVSGQPAFRRSLPFDYANQSLPVGMTQGSSTEATSYASPAALSYGPEMPLSPAMEEEEDEEDEGPEVKVEQAKEAPPKRKRGRPRLNRTAAEASAAAANGHRVPHNQVERKYRETLNAEMERLRVNIPTLPRSDGDSLAGPPRPSKATVLAAAVEYIKDLEHDVDALADENDGLKHDRDSRSRGSARRRARYA